MTIILPNKVLNANKKVRILTPVRPPRSVRVAYNKKLDDLNNALKNSNNELLALINRGASATEIVDFLRTSFESVNNIYDASAPILATAFVNENSKTNKELYENTIKRAFNISFADIIDDENVATQLDLATLENVKLIKSIPNVHFDKIAKAIKNNLAGLPQEGNVSLTQRIIKIGNISKNKASFIAKDQTKKITSSLNRVRSQNIGLEDYKWATAGNEKVVGNPSGLYPKPTNIRVHGNHYKRNGKIFSYNNPPIDGNPGDAPGCQCVALTVADIDKLSAVYVNTN